MNNNGSFQAENGQKESANQAAIDGQHPKLPALQKHLKAAKQAAYNANSRVERLQKLIEEAEQAEKATLIASIEDTA